LTHFSFGKNSPNFFSKAHGVFEGVAVLFAERVEMEAVEPSRSPGCNSDRQRAEPRTRRAGII